MAVADDKMIPVLGLDVWVSAGLALHCQQATVLLHSSLSPAAAWDGPAGVCDSLAP